ncbi:MAG TPA: carbohydrate ABC transporter permease [Ktedonosporobacter sp.]|nr:carbohydrate ABC transporter permease [Ktedonosporobacter sp.]
MTPWMERSSFIGRWSLRMGMALLAVVMLFPFVYVLAVSLSSPQDVSNSLIIFPSHASLAAFNWVLTQTNAVQGLEVSAFLVIVGTAINMLMTITMAYGLSRSDVPGSKIILWLVLLTLLIAPTIITKYLVVRQLHLIDTIWSLILPGAIAPFNLIVLRQFFLGIPRELIESAELDGAGEFRILWHIVLPLSKASLAVIALFYAVAQWNNFFDAVLFINSPQLEPIALVLREIVLQGNVSQNNLTASEFMPPSLAVQMAVVVIATIPILVVYPFLQKYFTKGVLTGSIKG